VFLPLSFPNPPIDECRCTYRVSSGAALRIFPYQHIERWAFDVELLYLAVRQGVPMVEVPVEWEEVDGSKVDMLADTLNMARDIILIRLCYLIGLWKYTQGPAQKKRD
jgi:dolichyl-phosphate beta-glucosyltransferase